MLGKHDVLWKGGRPRAGQAPPQSWGHTHLWELLQQHSQPCSAFSSAYTTVSPWSCRAQQDPRKHPEHAVPWAGCSPNTSQATQPQPGQLACGLPGFPSPTLAPLGLFPLLDCTHRARQLFLPALWLSAGTARDQDSGARGRTNRPRLCSENTPCPEWPQQYQSPKRKPTEHGSLLPVSHLIFSAVNFR